MKKYENQLRLLYENGMFYSGTRKTFVGKVEYHNFFKHSRTTINTFGYYCYNDKVWVVFVTDEERGIQIRRHEEDTEEKAITFLIELAENCNFSYHYQTIINDFSKAENEITLYLETRCGYSETKAIKALAYLLQVRSIAFEYWYFIKHGKYVLDKFATKCFGYTAKRLKQETRLTELGAFNYMVYLKRKPEEALANLKKGLPRRRLLSPQDVEELKKHMD